MYIKTRTNTHTQKKYIYRVYSKRIKQLRTVIEENINGENSKARLVYFVFFFFWLVKLSEFRENLRNVLSKFFF